MRRPLIALAVLFLLALGLIAVKASAASAHPGGTGPGTSSIRLFEGPPLAPSSWRTG